MAQQVMFVVFLFISHSRADAEKPSEKKFEVAKYVGLMILRCS